MDLSQSGEANGKLASRGATVSDAIQVLKPVFRVEECLIEIRECLEAGWTGMGFKTVQFEEAWKCYTGLPHAHLLNSATVGLDLALRTLRDTDGWQDGDEVITTPLTFVSTNHAILYQRLTPVFADVDRFLCLDPESIESRITPRTRAVVFVGLGGNTGQLSAVRDLCHRRGLRLILDAAHMSGSRLHGQHVGSEADVAVFSFQAVKNLPTADSGMICFMDADLDGLARKLTWLGINKDTFSRTVKQGSYKWHYDVEHLGYKYHGNSVIAAIGIVGLRYLDEDNAYRRQLAAWYQNEIGAALGDRIVPIAPGCESSRHLFQVLLDRRNDVLDGLAENHVYAGVHYRDNKEYRMYRHAFGDCPKARRASSETISLPLHLGMTHDDVIRVSQSLLNTLRQLQIAIRTAA